MEYWLPGLGVLLSELLQIREEAPARLRLCQIISGPIEFR